VIPFVRRDDGRLRPPGTACRAPPGG
jgi:hypothetical protein